MNELLLYASATSLLAGGVFLRCWYLSKNKLNQDLLPTEDRKDVITSGEGLRKALGRTNGARVSSQKYNCQKSP